MSLYIVDIHGELEGDYEEIRKYEEGEWVDHADKIEKTANRHFYECPHCGQSATYFIGGTEDWWCVEAPNYCPHCGDPMKGNTITVEVKHQVLMKDDIKDVDPEDNVFVAAAENIKQTISLVREDQDKFIFEAMVPFLTEINHIVIPKRVLERALFTFKEEHTAEWEALMKEYGGTGV